MTLVSRQPLLEDRDRDLAAAGRSDWKRYCPWLVARWTNVDGAIPPESGASDEQRQAPTDSNPSFETPGRSEGLNLDTVRLSTAGKPVAEDIGERILHTSANRFDHSFIEIECDMTPLQASIEKIKGDAEKGIRPGFDQYLAALNDPKQDEDACMVVFCTDVNALGRDIVGEDYKDLFQANGKTLLNRSSKIHLDVKHGRDDWDDAGHRVKPDILVRRRAYDGDEYPPPAILDWREVVASGEGKEKNILDMRAIGKEMEISGLRMLKYLVSIRRFPSGAFLAELTETPARLHLYT